MSAVDLSKEEARYLLDCMAYFRDSPAFRERYTEVTFGLACKLAPIANGPDDDGEGGASVPAGDNPDSPPAGEARVPGRDSIPVAPGLASYDPWDNWPVIPAGYSAISISNARVLSRNGHWYEVPEGTSTTDFLASLENSE